MLPNYKSPFRKFVKKQAEPLQLVIEDAVEIICVDPGVGERKTGDLQGIFVYKFTHKQTLYLIAYRPPSDDEYLGANVDLDLLSIDFYKVGTHENFYLDLKKYLKS